MRIEKGGVKCMTHSTFFGVKRRKKEKPDLSYLFRNSADYGGWGGAGENNEASHQKKTKKRKKQSKLCI